MSTMSLVTHLRQLSVSAKTLGLHTQLDIASLRVEVCGTDRYFELGPEFATFDPRGPREFSHQVLPQSRIFTGWRHAPKKSCAVSNDKRVFMAFCARNEVRTPRAYARFSEANADVVIKQIVPGVRGVIRGPFKPGRIPADCLQPSGDLILQEFVTGHMLEAWYWDGQLFAVEIHNRPHVVGDGVSAVRELIACNSLSSGWIDWVAAEDAVRFQGATLDTVLPAGKEVAVDIRFASALQRPEPENVLNTLIGTPVHAQLLRAGPVFCKAIPEKIRPHTQFVLSAIIDAQQRLWFTDMTTDLRVHPDGYDLMLRGLFGIPIPVSVSAPSPSAGMSFANGPSGCPVAS